MNKWKGSFGAKVGAWIGLTISAVLFLGSIVGVVLMQEMGAYAESKEVLRRDAYKDVAEQYAIRALEGMTKADNSSLNDTYFRYGIIKADNIDELDFNDESIYVQSNFTKEVDESSLYKTNYQVGENTQYYYSGTLFGGSQLHNSAPSYQVSAQAYRVCYNISDGVFYYETSGDLFPVRNVRIGRNANAQTTELYSFSYDFDAHAYDNEGVIGPLEAAETGSASDLAEGSGITGAASQAAEAENADTVYVADLASTYAAEAADGVLERDNLTFDMFDNTEWSYRSWDYLLLDGVTYYNNGDILLVDSTYIAEQGVTAETDYELTENNILHINHTDEDVTESYWVVVDLPEAVGTGWNGDLFVQANTVIGLAYSLRYSVFIIMAAAFGLAIFFFGFLLCAAGHRRGTQEIVATPLEHMPFDLYLGLVAIVEACMLVVTANFGWSMTSIIAAMAVVFLILVTGWLLLLSILTFAVRVKLGKWWRNTIVYYIYALICRAIRFCAENISMMWKAALIFGTISILEFFILVYSVSYGGGGVILWLGIEAAQLVAIFLGAVQMQRLKEGGERLAEGDLEHRIETDKMYWEFRRHGDNLNSVSLGMSKAVDERMKSERFKTELITNVSHDIKTPLTSIINYVDLLEKEALENETAREYLDVLDRQSERLKKLIEDLMEASKASTGNLAVHLEKLEVGVSLVQTIGEFEEKTEANGLELLISKPETPVYILADSRHFWRVIDNLMNNICKYAQPSTRVYINLEEQQGAAVLTFRNTSRYPLNITSEELMERFVRGDSSRNTEGSGLGISIARSLMELMEGTFELYVDGDLFKVVLTFKRVAE